MAADSAAIASLCPPADLLRKTPSAPLLLKTASHHMALVLYPTWWSVLGRYLRAEATCRRRHVDRLEEQPRPMQRTPSQEGFLGPGGRPGGGGLPPWRLPCFARHIACATKVGFPKSKLVLVKQLSVKVCGSADSINLCREPSPSSSAAPAAPSEPHRDAAPSTAPSTAAAPPPSVAPLSADAAKNKVAIQAVS